jgi:hypothetical protein
MVLTVNPMLLMMGKNKHRIKGPTSTIMGRFTFDCTGFYLVELIKGWDCDPIGPPEVQMFVLLWEPL